jgi:hypothetical protein
MTELTQQDRDNYKKLQKIVDILRKAITADSKDQPTQKMLLKSLFDQLFPAKPPLSALPDELETIEELESRLDKIDAYLGPQNLLLTPLPPEIDKATQELLKQSALIKESLQDIKDADLSTLDDIGSPCSDEQFFQLIKGKPKSWTKNLLENHPLNLDDKEITQLTDAWGIAVSGIVDDAQKQGGKLIPGKTDTIFRFFCIHEELEDLYDKVSNLVA